jgi:hypothetical protein
MNKFRLLFLIFTISLFSNFFISFNAEACKDIIACGNATEGDYNLLLKVRDPSRLGLQVLCIVPEGYEYTYRYPWTGKPMSCKVLHKFIGVATKKDTIPNIVKAGMSLSDVGIAYGDADTDSRWINPTKNAWDDFDWIRYACEKANNEDEAVSLMTKDVVKKMHATGVSENLFIVGPKKGYVIEADAFRYKTREIVDGIDVMSNYPKDLWKTQREKKFPISRAFDTVVEEEVRNKGTIRLNSLYGIRIVEIGENYIYVVPISFYYILKTKSFGVITKINLGERKTVGYFSVELLDIDDNKAKVRVCNIFKAWEEKILEYIQSEYGSITVKDMINWSRLHNEDLDGLRPMCEYFYEYESVAIYKIPKEDYEIMSMGWFSPNHACSSIYVPFHICDKDIYDPYETGEAAELSLNLLKEYRHGILNSSFANVEEVFLNEVNIAEQISKEQIKNPLLISDFLTVIDMGMQRQAFLTEQIWMEIKKITDQDKKWLVTNSIDKIWDKNYSNSLKNMKNSVLDLKELSNTGSILNKISKIALDICKSRIDAADAIGKQTQTVEEEFNESGKLIEQGDYENGFDSLQKVYTYSDMLIKGQTFQDIKNIDIKKDNGINIFLYFLITLFIIVFIIFISRYRLVSQ